VEGHLEKYLEFTRGSCRTYLFELVPCSFFRRRNIPQTDEPHILARLADHSLICLPMRYDKVSINSVCFFSLTLLVDEQESFLVMQAK
jgi:hypothetical protein